MKKQEQKKITMFVSTELHKQIKKYAVDCGEAMKDTLTRWLEIMAKKEIKS